MTNGCVIQEPYPPDEGQDGDAYIIDYDEWQAVLRIIRAAEKERDVWAEGDLRTFLNDNKWHIRWHKTMCDVREALEALPEHLRGK
jgi:hypothetical protein